MITMKSSSGSGSGDTAHQSYSEPSIKSSGIRGSNAQNTRPSPLRRRRLSKGLIADDGSRAGSGDKSRPDSDAASAPSGTAPGNPVDPSAFKMSSPEQSSAPSLPKPCYSGRLALVCVQNALQMGIRTKFFLCPKGKARKSLIAKAKSKRNRKHRDLHRSRSTASNEAERASLDQLAEAHERVEDEFLKNPSFKGSGGDSAEEYSSGDDDDFDESIEDDERGSKELHSLEREKEPLFIPTGSDAAAMGLQGGQAAGMNGGKLPFNYRKVRYFDLVTAPDRAVVRSFLRQEVANAKKLRSQALSNHLKKAQLREKERIRKAREMGVQPNSMPLIDDGVEGNDTVDLKSEQTALATALTRFPNELTPTLSAALLIESLAMNHLESIEGMAKCYDGIVSAGTALLDLAHGTTHDGGTSQGGKKKLTTSEIMSALAPLLITTLEQSSGDVIVALAKLRKFSGTRRYQRRFVQRVAPFLVRPPNAAIWCLRHQTDIEPIMAATEMILDNAFDVFSSGWFERGRSMLKDTQRAETFRTAASQLRRLNSNTTSDGILVGLSTPGSSLTLRRGHSFVGSLGARKDGSGSGNESLAEWEVLAVDNQIRQSILDVFSRDWSRISSLNLSPKDGDTPFGSRHRRGISALKSKSMESSHDMAAVTSGSTSFQASNFGPNTIPSMSAASLAKSPRSKIPLSPRGVPGSSTGVPSHMPSADALESAFGPSFSSQMIDDESSESPTSPTHYPLPAAPLSPKRDTMKSITPKTPPSHYGQRTEDRASVSSFHDQTNNFHAMSPEPQPSSPYSRGSGREPDSISSRIGLAPLSPQSSVGNASHSSLGTMSQRSAPSSSPAMRNQYRALTSTAADRKKTVAACRALRAQIAQFEDAFIQMHGRAPKGAAERAPLASTYMQYREWKRAIRSDAACRIQALCRGARVRWMLLQSGDPQISRIVSLRVVRQPSVDNHRLHGRKPEPIPDNLKDLSIPLDIGSEGTSYLEQESNRDGVDSSLARTRLETRGDDGVEVEMVMMQPDISASSGSVLASSPPNWSSRQRNQLGRVSPVPSHSNRSPSGKSRIILPDVTVMSLAELQQRKRELKQQLKLYDMNFHKQHGRMPEKREKEPIRHLYESYNAYKNQITVIEKGEALPGPGTAAFRGKTDVTVSVPVADSSPDGVSPTFNAGNTSPNLANFKKTASLLDDAEGEDVQQDQMSTPVASSQDLAALKAEKATLHQMLRSYEKDFFKQHKRQVSSYDDIRPVASQYRRYKEIKKAIASLQDK